MEAQLIELAQPVFFPFPLFPRRLIIRLSSPCATLPSFARRISASRSGARAVLVTNRGASTQAPIVEAAAAARLQSIRPPSGTPQGRQQHASADAGRGSLISPGFAGRRARVGDPPRPCQPRLQGEVDARSINRVNFTGWAAVGVRRYTRRPPKWDRHRSGGGVCWQAGNAERQCIVC